MDDLGVVLGASIILARFAVPLTIPKFPVPGLLASLVLDAVDQTVFQATNTQFDGYQSYDKALDVYYLTIAYASTLRNWSSPWALGVGRFLWYYRLVGVLLFELAGWRPLLLIFPNVFEYFFLCYELIRVRRDPALLSQRFVTYLALVLWVGVKLPQEWWIHIARLDLTEQVAAHPGASAVLGVALAGLLLVLLMALRKVLPPPSWRFTFAVDTHLPPLPSRRGLIVMPVRSRRFLWAAVEKTVLITLVSSVFAQILPGVVATATQMLFGTATIVVLNAVVSQFFARRGLGWRTTTRQFFAMGALNVAIIVALAVLTGGGTRADVDLGDTAFLLGLLTLIVTMVDRYQAARAARWGAGVS